MEVSKTKTAKFYEKQPINHISSFSMKIKIIFKNPMPDKGALWSHLVSSFRWLPVSMPLSSPRPHQI